MLGLGTLKHVATNEVARGVILSDMRFNALVDEVGEDNIKLNHTRSKEVKNELFNFD